MKPERPIYPVIPGDVRQRAHAQWYAAGAWRDRAIVAWFEAGEWIAYIRRKSREHVVR